MQFDEILKDLGDFGRYQKLVYLCICLLAIPCSWHTLGNTYLSASPRHYCRITQDQVYQHTSQLKSCSIPRHENIGWDSCNRYSNLSAAFNVCLSDGSLEISLPADTGVVGCDRGWVYDTTYYGSTAVSQWNLVCERKSQRQLSKSLVMVGKMVGSAVFGQLADILGRKTMLLFGLVMQTCFGVGAAFSPNFPVFCIMQFLLGMTSSGIFVTAFVIGTEFVGTSKRAFAGIAIRIFYSIGMMLLAVIAWFLREWSHIELAISVPPIIFLIYYWILPESPRWLISQGREEDAKKILIKAAQINGVTIKAFEASKHEKQQTPDKRTLQRRHSAVDLVRTPNMRIKTMKIYFNWISSSMAYYGLSFLTEDLGSDPYTAFFIAGAVEIPAYIICLLLLNRIGRKWLTSIFMVIGGTALLCALPVPNDYTNVTLVIAMTGKLCISGSYAIVYLYAAELFPTPIRNAGVGMGSFASRIGSILAPQILLLGDLFFPVLPLAIFGGLALIAGLMVLLLPETLNKKLPETLEEGEEFGKGKSAWRRMTGQSSKVTLVTLADLPEVFENVPPIAKTDEANDPDEFADVTITICPPPSPIQNGVNHMGKEETSPTSVQNGHVNKEDTSPNPVQNGHVNKEDTSPNPVQNGHVNSTAIQTSDEDGGIDNPSFTAI